METDAKKKVLIAMSGGVDSSVAAYLIKEKGYDAAGVTLKMFGNELIGEDLESSCCSLSDVNDAESVCRTLGIPFYVYNFTEKFEREVIKRFVSAYRAGLTPNPCIDCNRYIKFGWLYRRLKELGGDYVVTGHYARTFYDESRGRYVLMKSRDPGKDQTYVLAALSQEQLAHTLFPLGEMKKTETRKIADEQGFVNAAKKDSQDICFAPDGDYAGFIERYTGSESEHGDFVDEDGGVLGEHKGVIKYTIGQRKGLGLALKAPMYVVEKDAENNRIVLGPNEHLFSRELEAEDFNWVSMAEPDEPFRASAKVRYSQKESPALVTPLGGGRVKVVFDEPERAITPGQALVIYDGDYVVGGGTIVK